MLKFLKETPKAKGLVKTHFRMCIIYKWGGYRLDDEGWISFPMDPLEYNLSAAEYDYHRLMQNGMAIYRKLYQEDMADMKLFGVIAAFIFPHTFGEPLP